MILAARSLYFSALLQRSDQLPADVLSGDNDSHDLLPAIKLGDVTAGGPVVCVALTWCPEGSVSTSFSLCLSCVFVLQ